MHHYRFWSIGIIVVVNGFTLDLPNKMHLYKQKQKVPFYEPMTLVKSYNNTNIGEY